MSGKDIFNMLNSVVYRDYFFDRNERKDRNERPIFSNVGKNKREAKKKHNKRK